MSDNPRIEELRRRVHKDPASIAFAQLAEEYRRAGEHEEAVRVCRTGLAKHPSYLSARVTLGRALIELEQYEEAHTELDYVLRSAPENLAAIRGLAEIHQRRGELNEALKQYETALAIAQHDPELEETVQELARQLGGSTQARTEVRAYETPQTTRTEVRADESPNVQSAENAQHGSQAAAALPTATAGAGSQPEEPGSQRVALVQAPPPLDTFELPEEPSGAVLSAELEAAADEFTRALEALDAITIDLPTPPLEAEPFELPTISVLEDDRLVPAADWEQAAFDAASMPVPAAAVDARAPSEASTEQPAGAGSATDAQPDPDAAAIADLQNWLDNIVLDRSTK